MPDEMWVRGESGALLVFDAATLHEGIRHRLDRGDLVRVNADGTPWTGQADDDEGDEDDDTPPDAPALPKRTANRQAWTDFAISQGMDREQANNMTKAELITEFTRERTAD